MSEYTPGPWLAAKKPSSAVGWPVLSNDGKVICDILSRSGDDAHLIAAAPDLLKALEIVMDDYECAAEGWIGDSRQNAQERMSIARSAIAKARGRHE